MELKWSSVQIPLSDVLKAIGHTPLYGHKSGKHMQTHWLAFVKLEQQDLETCPFCGEDGNREAWNRRADNVKRGVYTQHD